MTGSSSLAARCYSTEARARKYVKGYGFLSFTGNLSKKYGKHILEKRKNPKKPWPFMDE